MIPVLVCEYGLQGKDSVGGCCGVLETSSEEVYGISLQCSRLWWPPCFAALSTQHPPHPLCNSGAPWSLFL